MKKQSRQENVMGLRSETQTRQGSRLGSALLSAFRQAQQSRQQTRQATQQINQLGFRNRGRQTPRPPRIRLGLDLPEDNIISRKGLSAKDILGFAIEIRRKGRFRVLGNAESSLQSALSKAQRYTDVTLARSFRLRNIQTGELVSPSSVSPIFKASKKEAKTFVELPKYSLGGSEQREISLFKKSRRSKNVFRI